MERYSGLVLQVLRRFGGEPRVEVRDRLARRLRAADPELLLRVEHGHELRPAAARVEREHVPRQVFIREVAVLGVRVERVNRV